MGNDAQTNPLMGNFKKHYRYLLSTKTLKWSSASLIRKEIRREYLLLVVLPMNWCTRRITERYMAIMSSKSHDYDWTSSLQLQSNPSRLRPSDEDVDALLVNNTSHDSQHTPGGKAKGISLTATPDLADIRQLRSQKRKHGDQEFLVARPVVNIFTCSLQMIPFKFKLGSAGQKSLSGLETVLVCPPWSLI